MTRRSLWLTVLVLGAVSLPALTPVASADPPHRVPPPLAGASDVAAMNDLETKMVDSLRFGHAVPIDFATASRVPGDVVNTGGWGDSGLWTGVYLGGEAMRYAVARKHLSDREDALGRGERSRGRRPSGATAFWRVQRDQALGRIRTILAAEHRDINIAEDWTGQLRVPPSVNTQNPGGTHAADFGGGVIHGERGMIMRACTPVGSGPMGVSPPTADAAHPVNNNSNRVFEITWKSGDGGTYDCESSPSRDTYAGVTFGLLTAFDLVGPDQPALRAQIRDDLLAMGNFLLKYGWSYPRPHGYVSAKHDFDGFISPLMVYVPMARLNMTNAARHVADAAGSADDKLKWDAAWAEEFATEGSQLGASMAVDSAQPNDGYYKFNLHHLAGFNLLRTNSGTERREIARGFAVMDSTTRDHLNAHFEAITYSATGETPRLEAAVTHLRQWLDYRANLQTGAAVKNSARCSTNLACVPVDQYEVAVPGAPGGSVTWHPGAPAAPPVSSSAGTRAARPLPVALRPPTDFLWQRAPTALDGQEPATHREPGIDFLTPYWMIRYFTEVAPPASSPFPLAPGVKFQ